MLLLAYHPEQRANDETVKRSQAQKYYTEFIT